MQREDNSARRWAFGLGLPGTNAGTNETAAIVFWLIRLRWIALIAQVLAGAVGFRLVFLEPLLIYPYFGTLAFLCLFNFYSASRIASGGDSNARTLFTQVAVDTISFSFLLALSGGTRNPFVPLLFIHATLGALLLKGRSRGWFLALILMNLVILYLARDWQVLSSDIYVWELIPLLATFLSILVSWALVTSLADTLSKTRNSLLLAESHKARINHLLALGALTAEFAHQFATPLNTLRMRIARLQRREPEGARSEDLKAISETLDQSERVLREMTVDPLDSSMLAFEEIELGPFVKATIETWSAASGTQRIALLNHLESSSRCRVPKRIFAKSLSNLLDNAALAESGVNGIEVEMSDNSNNLFVAVKDRGPGWPSEIKQNGIRPHFTTHPGGTGLGLFNCQSLCEVMGGSLELLDRSGGGAIAKLALPKVL